MLNKFLVSSFVFLICGSIILSGVPTAKIFTGSEFNFVDVIVIIGFLFLIVGITMFLVSLFKQKK
ncbi:MAG: hypothetical protein SO253_00675 [Bacilli bacterium]|nr:hypothetical protein [Bacilli bacterium]